MKKFFLLILGTLCVSIVSFAEVYSGSCGENMTWTMDTKQKTLIIKGSGEMDGSPWRDYEEYESIEKLTIGNGVSSIEYDAFSALISLKSVTLPSTLLYIGENAFSGCSSLRSIIIPNSVTYLGSGTFAGCSNLSSVALSNMLSKIEERTFVECESLSSVSISDNVTVIGKYAFLGCMSLSSVTIPNSVSEIEASAFSGCESLTEIHIPDNITEIKERTFEGCSSLVSVIFPDGLVSIGSGAFGDCSSLTDVFIPDNVISIESFAFNSCGFMSIRIPAGVMEIGRYAFGGGSLCYIDVDETNPYFSSDDGILYNKGKTQLVCYPSKKSNSTFIIPSSVKIIGEWAVWNKYIKTLIIPASVTKIRANAFFGSDFSSVVNYAEEPQEINFETFIYGSNSSHGDCTLYVPKESLQSYNNAEGWREFPDIKPISEFLEVPLITSERGKTHKILQDGIMYIQREKGSYYTIDGKKINQ